jgi:hypothetical protein
MPEEMVLPVEPRVPDVDMGRMRWLFHSYPKVGKTSMVAQFPSTIILDTEEGTRALRVRAIPCNSWEDLAKAVDLLGKKKHDYQTVAIDSIGRACDFLEDAVAEEAGVDGIEDMKYGAGYREVRRRMTNYLSHIFNELKLGLVLTAHTRLVRVIRKKVEMMRMAPDLSDSQRKMVCGFVDQIVYLDMREEVDAEGSFSYRRIAVTQPRPDVEAGGRLQYLDDEIVLPSPRAGYAALEASFKEAAQKLIEEVSPPRKRGKK